MEMELLEQPQGFSDELAASQPANTTILISNLGPNMNIIALPGSGTLWVAYEYQQTPAKRVYLWHQGGETVTIPPGVGQQIPSRPGDMLIYELASPTQTIKLGWAYL